MLFIIFHPCLFDLLQRKYFHSNRWHKIFQIQVIHSFMGCFFRFQRAITLQTKTKQRLLHFSKCITGMQMKLRIVVQDKIDQLSKYHLKQPNDGGEMSYQTSIYVYFWSQVSEELRRREETTCEVSNIKYAGLVEMLIVLWSNLISIGYPTIR